MNAMSKQSADINEVIAHFELNLKRYPRNQQNNNYQTEENNKKKPEDIVKFEMNREEIQQMLQQFTQIQTVYQQLISKTSTN